MPLCGTSATPNAKPIGFATLKFIESPYRGVALSAVSQSPIPLHRAIRGKFPPKNPLGQGSASGVRISNIMPVMLNGLASAGKLLTPAGKLQPRSARGSGAGASPLGHYA